MAVRKSIIARDMALDLGILGFPINTRIIVHHMNPLSLEDIEYQTDKCFDPENLITVSEETHNRIHYRPKAVPFEERKAGDTILW